MTSYRLCLVEIATLSLAMTQFVIASDSWTTNKKALTFAKALNINGCP